MILLLFVSLRILFAHFSCVYLLIFVVFVSNFSKLIQKAMGAIGMYQMREQLYEDRGEHRHLNLR